MELKSPRSDAGRSMGLWPPSSAIQSWTGSALSPGRLHRPAPAQTHRALDRPLLSQQLQVCPGSTTRGCAGEDAMGSSRVPGT
ncbi:hypothetical protein MDA_GLEAN10014294 [Myotis davidii]|uniref:Uncharacterized protein n=1 Tax=Myotis davidii TaxID=225400 RepID=L5MJF1_MYODS|nr:hypothetical protein MDA_GLEAN10014294 [Myotis davidii]